MEEIKFKVKNISTTIIEDLNPGDKIIRTKDWGNFKIRKNGKYMFKIGKDIIRVSKIKKGANNENSNIVKF